jgi:predicted ribosomally synthesized peptide with SipW-like signal peptide
MKKILFSLLVITFVSILIVGGTKALFTDSEISVNNTFLTGTIDIDIDDENPWTGGIEVGDIKPGEGRNFEWTVNNVGTYPANAWLTFDNLVNLTGLQSEPECVVEDGTWDDVNEVCENMSNEENGIDEVFDYTLRVEVYGLNAGGKVWSQKIYTENYTLADIKDRDIILGMIPVGGYMKVFQEFSFQHGAGNEYQGDIAVFDVKIAAEQLRGTLVLENKDTSTWEIKHDNVQAILNYTTKAPEFSYSLIGSGLLANEIYGLIYHSEGGASNRLIGEGTTDSSGDLMMDGSNDLGINIPADDDGFYPDGGKVWLLPEGRYNSQGIVNWGGMGNYLWETALIIYERTDFGPVVIPNIPTGLPVAPEASGGGGSVILPPVMKTAYFNTLGSDIANQYGYNHDYGTAAANNVHVAYPSAMTGSFAGTMQASGLKPYATYQVKFAGTPTCVDSINGDDTLNDYIGSIGRWWNNDSNSNANDTQKASNPGDCYTGYLVIDYITADSNGDIIISDITVMSDTSYHVLFCGGGTCNSNSNDFATYGIMDSGVQFCQASGVNGQPEPSRGGCSGLVLSSGIYNLTMSLTEECFHQPTSGTNNWAEVLTGNIEFEIL